MTKTKLLMATLNDNKLSEIRVMFKDSGLSNKYELISLKGIGFNNTIPEEENTLEANASSKAHYVYKLYNMNCFADDTGLEVEALGGLPGVHSARYAGNKCNSEDNNKKLLTELNGVNDRKARFRTVISLMLDGKEYLFEGKVEGEIITELSGEEGFGYDPVFRPYGHDLTFASMPLDQKNRISHRYLAFKKMTAFLLTN